MLDLNPDYESQHRGNISKLIELYGLERESEIKDLYQQYRTELESVATVKDHLPFFTYQQTERILIQKYGKPKNKKETSRTVSQEQPQTQEQPRKRRGLLKLLPQ